jgi:hypothetical protein
MSSTVVVPQLDRIQYFAGEQLTAADLNYGLDVDDTLRWLHNRTLHGWGIATGLGVTGSVAGRSVTVAPGMAIDSAGREIILAKSVVQAIPSLPSGSPETLYYLAASYLPTGGQNVVKQRTGICRGSGAVRLANDPLLTWQLPTQIVQGEQIILAGVWINNCSISRAVSSAPRRMLTPPKKPSVASGQVSAESIVWTPIEAGGSVTGFSAAVDTSAAQFQSTPQYLAEIVGENYLATGFGPLLAVAHVSVADASPTAFTLRALLLEGTAGVPVNPPPLRNAQTGIQIIQQLGWQIAWMGVAS